MKNTITFLFLLINLTCFSQNEAYYINAINSSGSDLVLVNYDSTHIVKQAYSFHDSATKVKSLSFQLIPLNYFPSTNLPLATEIKTDSINNFYNLHFGPISVNTVDSLKVNGKWYKIKTHFDDDRFVGGMPNRVNKKIWVSGLGTVYSYNNFYNGHELLMLCHEDKEKQAILETVYRYLEKTNKWFNWSKMTELTNTYTFNNCFTKMSELWLKSRCDLVISSVKSTPIGNTIKYDVTLKNVSTINYAFPNYYSIAPSKAFITVADSLQTWDLLNTHSGRYFKRVNHQYYLLPGDTLSFSQTLNINTGSSTIVKFEGFQIHSTLSFYNWLFGSVIINEGENYELFKFRELYFDKL